MLYTFLTSEWPLAGADAARAGLAAAELGPDGALPAPSERRPGVPVELDTLTRGALGPDDAPGHVHTAAAMQRLLGEVVAEEDRMALFPPVHDGVPSEPGDVWQDRDRTAAPPDPQRRRKLTVALTVLGAAVLVVLGYVGVQVGSCSPAAGTGRRSWSRAACPHSRRRSSPARPTPVSPSPRPASRSTTTSATGTTPTASPA
ncbi:hypothetical protein BJF78_25475 [Pseudonocardia sp. CNS-139]|nr:hypothetical protein BJF78_25475 [Pseudonocardia sp. CNS-139]